MHRKIAVFVVAPAEPFYQAVWSLLGTQHDITLVGRATCCLGDELQQLPTPPDVILVDLALLPTEAGDAAAWLEDMLGFASQLILISSPAQKEWVLYALQRGVCAHFVKEYVDAPQIAEAVRTVQHGMAVLCRYSAAWVLDALSENRRCQG